MVNTGPLSPSESMRRVFARQAELARLADAKDTLVATMAAGGVAVPPRTSRVPATPAEVREWIKLATALWFPRTDLVGGFVTRRARLRHDADEEAREAAYNADCKQLQTIAALPDGDLQWLLDQGWQPQAPRR